MSQIRPSSHRSQGPAVPALRPTHDLPLGESPEKPYADWQPADLGSSGLAEYWHILGRRKGVLILTAILGASVAFSLTRIQSPLYRAQTLLEIEDLNVDFLNMRSVSPMAPTSPFQVGDPNLRTQAMVLQSGPVLERAIDQMDLEKRLVASVRAARTFASDKVRVTPDQDAAPQREQALDIAKSALKVRPEPNTRVVEVTFDSTDPQVAADFLHAIAAGFSEISLERRSQISQNTSEWLNKQLADVRTKLATAEDAMQRYASASGLTFFSEKDNADEEHLRQLQLELVKAQEDRVIKQSKYELVATVPAESLPEVLDDPTLKEYQVQLTTLNRQLAELTSSYTSAHPKVVNVRAQITTLEAALVNKRSNIISRIQNEYASAQRRERLLTTDYAAQVGLVSKQAATVAHYSMLKRDVDTTRQLYDSLTQRVREAGLASAMRASEIHVIESATPPRVPYTPNVVLNTAFGLLSGICMGVGFVIWRVRSERGIQNPGETIVSLNVPELGVIPASTADRPRFRRLLGNRLLQGRLELMAWQRRPSMFAESVRLTLTSILLSKNRVPPRIIVLSSANPGEGKTTVISNLGIALAQANRRVLLIDGDVRKPRLHEIFEIDNSIGLSEALESNSSVAVRETRITNLYLLPSGKRADQRLFFASGLRPFLQRLKREFDIILIDTPPLLQMSDARLMCHQADAVVLVVAQHTARDAVALAQARLAEDGSSLLGTILNNWDPKTSSHGYRHHSDYYKRYYANGGAR
ncbi:MAG: lipopolysaccharide biosynthesis [Bryobacterales bacterium]|nr:lipopolysaccharide biosynthesis [Bryobacterales bacterium]